jgi:hypothetical protein
MSCSPAQFVAAVSRCPCISLLLVYVFALVMSIILGLVLSRAAKDDGLGAIVSQVAQYELNDVRSIKQDSFELAMKDMKEALKKLEDDEDTEPEEEREQTQMAGIFYMMYEGESGAGYDIFSVGAAEEIAKVEALATGRDDFKEYCLRYDNERNLECQKVELSPLRFLYASEFNVEAAKAVVEELKKPEVMKAHKIMGPCVDRFHMVTAQALWPTKDLSNVTAHPMFNGRSCDAAGLLTDAQEQASFELSQKIVAITMKFDGKAEAPVQDMPALAEFIAYIKELPSQAMLVDFHLDNKFNSTNTKCKFTRSILPFGGPLDRKTGDGERMYKNTEDKEDEQEKALRKYIIDNLESDFAKAAKGSYSDKISVYYFMTALIFDIFIKILQMDGMLAFASIGMVFTYIWVTTGSGFLAVVGMSEIVLRHAFAKVRPSLASANCEDTMILTCEPFCLPQHSRGLVLHPSDFPGQVFRRH